MASPQDLTNHRPGNFRPKIGHRHPQAAVASGPDPVVQGLNPAQSPREAQGICIHGYSPPSGVSAVLGGVAEFKVKLLAVLDSLEDVDNQGAIGMINTIDLNQQYRRIPFIAKDESQVILVLFKYGIKVMEVNSPVVLYRHPLYSIQRVVCYDDGLGKQVVAIKVGQPRKTKYGLLAFQCNSQDQATEICRTLATIIEVITTPERS
uniref:PID domain-containing protein n=1 Tax=Branchiostoma floridae TaxID=7739 RepID=C4A017_BRAFL|eukprot:XP_002585866.1 hypothetical protein BRAFLDRAFT_132925 [Branchiostoma floridae]